MLKKSRMKNVFCLLTLLFIQACSNQNNVFDSGGEAISKTMDNFWISGTTEESSTDLNDLSDESSTINVTANNSKSVAKKYSSIEIVWVYPEHKVTNYILRYGTSEDNLDSVVEFPVEELKTSVHPDHGKVYTYLLNNVPAGASIYYSLQAKNTLGLSEPTPVAVEKSGM